MEILMKHTRRISAFLLVFILLCSLLPALAAGQD